MSVVALIDTNVWVSALLNPNGHPARLIAAWRTGRFTVTISLALLDELADVLSRPRIRKKYGLAPEAIAAYLMLISERAIQVEPPGHLRLCRDPDDDVVLETAILGQVRFLVSRDDDLKGDSDLVEQMRRHGIEVLSIQRFLTILDSTP